MELKEEDVMQNINLNPEVSTIAASLRAKVKLYKKRAKEVDRYLSKRPHEWGKFQRIFNLELDNIFHDIMNFEKINFINGCEDKVYKLKHIFVGRFRKLFMRGVYCKWSIDKPFGYAGDYKIIDDIYQNNPTTTGFDRLFDNYYQMSAICVGVRNRKEDFKRLIINFINKRQNDPLRIMNLACGSCREIKEMLSSNELQNKGVIFDCYDNDHRAIKYARDLLFGFSNVNLIKESALRLAATKDINSRIDKKYDFIYATGLFDYLNYKVSTRLAQNLKKLLKSNGELAISNVRDKYSNPSVHFMEWAGDWNLIYRDDDEFRKIFIDAGFKKGELETRYEQQGIMLYLNAKKYKEA